jgi:hypothetical protein
MTTARSFVITLLLTLAMLLGACSGDDAVDTGDDSPPAPDAGLTSDADSVDASRIDANRIDATPAIDGDLLNDAGPLSVSADFTLAEAQPADLPAFGVQGIAAIGWLDSEYLAVERSDVRHLVAQRLSPDGQLVGTPLELASDLGENDESRMACSGNRCLIVWTSVDPQGAAERMRGVILGPGLEVVTATPLAFGPAYHFALAATASGFMVARTLQGGGLTLLTVDRAGAVIAQDPLFAGSSFGSFAEEGPVLACGVNTCLVATLVCPPGTVTYVRRLVVTDLTGDAADPQGQVQDRLPQVLVSTGAQLAAVYSDGPHGAELVRLTDQGTPLGSPVVLGPRPTGVFFDGIAYGLLSSVFEDIPGPITTTIERLTITRVAVDGTVLLDGVNVFNDAAGVHGYGAVAGCHDGQCLVAAVKSFGPITDYDSVVTRLNAGHALDPAGRLVTTAAPAQLPSEVGSDGTDFLVVWRQQALEGDEVRARRVGADGTLSPGSQLIVPTTTTTATALAADGDAYLFGWVDAADGIVRLLSLDADGVPQAAPVEVAQVNLEVYQYTSLALSCHAAQCLVAWTDDHVHVRRVHGNGVPIDVAEVVLQPRLSLADVTVAYNGGQYAVGWVRHVQGIRDELDVALVAEDGPIDSPAVVVVTETLSYFGGAKLAPSGDGFLVAWEGTAINPDAVNQLKFAEVQPDGTVGAFMAAIGSTGSPVGVPELVENGQDVLVTGILPLGTFGADIETDGTLRLLRVGAGPRLLDEAPVDVGPVVFRWDMVVRGAANSQRKVLLVRGVFSNDVAHIGPHAVGRLVSW